MIIPILRGVFVGIGIFILIPLASCSAQNRVAKQAQIRLSKTHFHSFDGAKLPYTKWGSKEEPELVIIGVHGISGASSDFRPLAKHIVAKYPKMTLYGSETRGQGKDPVKERRGHIHNREEWFKDLTTFTSLIRKHHPKARIVWCGESMGSLIVLHTYARIKKREARCDAMILASPITDIRSDFPQWKISVANIAGFLFPKARVSLESLSGEDEVRVTKNTIHQEQASTNSYHIQKHTLRLLTTLGKMMQTSRKASQKLDLPLLVLHGGKDIFSDPKDVKRFFDGLPEKTRATRKFYPESFHLLFHDHQSDKVVADIATWVDTLPSEK
ncbi:MAG: alpha/beta fold hydrolase [Akkermansiaceae bacterium]|nr:alpha/beta fold hydrolase [Akkermansiaceae bacterium]